MHVENLITPLYYYKINKKPIQPACAKLYGCENSIGLKGDRRKLLGAEHISPGVIAGRHAQEGHGKHDD